MFRVYFLIAILAVQRVSAQPLDSLWSRTFGGGGDDHIQVVQQTPDGGFILFGYSATFGNGQQDYALMKVNAEGDSLWLRSFGGTGSSIGWAGTQASDGGYLIAGNSTAVGAGSSDFWLVKAGATGDSLWSRSYGGPATEYCYSIAATSDEGYALGGQTRSFGEEFGDMWLVKVNAQGDSLWSRTYGGTLREYCYQVIALTEGGFLLAGYTESFGNASVGIPDIWVVRTAANGDSLWSRAYGGTGQEHCYSALRTDDGGFLIAGRTESYGAGQYDAWLIKISANGDSLWSRTYGGALNETAYSVAPAPEGGYYLAGWTNSFGSGLLDYWLLAVDADGDSLWSETFGGPSHDQCYSVAPTSDGGVILGGATVSYGAGDADFWLIKAGGSNPVGRELVPIPNTLSLAVSPNPFNSSCTFTFDLPSTAPTSVRVLDLLGREMAILKQGTLNSGTHHVAFDARSYASGIYLVELQAGNQAARKKLVLLK